MKLYLVVRSVWDPAFAWHSCIVAADDVDRALDWCGVTPDDLNHITSIGVADPDIEAGIVLSSKH